MSRAVLLDFDRRPSALTYMLRAVAPARRRIDLAPQVVARWRGHVVDRTDLEAFRRITRQETDPEHLPLLYPHTFGFRLPMAILTHPAFPVPIWGVLQTRNHLVQHRPIAVDERLDFETRVLHGRAVAKGAEFDLHTTVHAADGELVWESLLTFFTRGRFGEPGPAAPAARSPSVTEPVVAEWTMEDADHLRFGRFTGDYNGIHLSHAYARRFGFPRALYHPPRVLGECLAHLGEAGRTATPVQLDTWLKGPVPHGAQVRLQAERTDDVCSFALFAGDERPAIIGRLGSAHMHGPLAQARRTVEPCTPSNPNSGRSTPTA
jgi:acyl dehydratase